MESNELLMMSANVMCVYELVYVGLSHFHHTTFFFISSASVVPPPEYVRCVPFFALSFLFYFLRLDTIILLLTTV